MQCLQLPWTLKTKQKQAQWEKEICDLLAQWSYLQNLASNHPLFCLDHTCKRLLPMFASLHLSWNCDVSYRITQTSPHSIHLAITFVLKNTGKWNIDPIWGTKCLLSKGLNRRNNYTKESDWTGAGVPETSNGLLENKHSPMAQNEATNHRTLGKLILNTTLS